MKKRKRQVMRMAKMSQTPTRRWKCSCGHVNPLRVRVCQRCQTPIPVFVRRAVYREELAIQKDIRWKFTWDRSQRRMTKLDQALTKGLPVVKVLCILAVVCFLVGVFLFWGSWRQPQNLVRLVSSGSDALNFTEYLARMQEGLTPLQDKLQNVHGHWEGLEESLTIHMDYAEEQLSRVLINIDRGIEKIVQLKELVESYVK